MGKALPLLILYGSFLSLPAAQEKGTLVLTYLYLAFAVTGTMLIVISRIRSPGFRLQQSELFFMSCCIVVTVLNLLVAAFNHIPMQTWAARTLHVPMMLTYYLTLRYSSLSIREILKTIFYLGLIEAGLIYWTYLFAAGVDVGRGTDIDGVIVYSIVLVASGFLSLLFYSQTGKQSYLWIYFIVLFASVLTGTRGLILSAAVLIFALRLSWIQAVAFILAMAGTYYLLVTGYLERFNIQDEDNMITILAKLEELTILWDFFLSSPIFGVGFGYEYQTSIAGTPYTYSHNALLFYLGYGGLIALPLFVLPLLQFSRAVPRGIFLSASVIMFYTTSTSFTNVKHSLTMAAMIYVAARILERRRMRVAAADPPAADAEAQRST